MLCIRWSLTNIATLQNVEGVFGKCNLESVGLEGSSLYDGWLRADERGSFRDRNSSLHCCRFLYPVDTGRSFCWAKAVRAQK
jgi:hypothetical protein